MAVTFDKSLPRRLEALAFAGYSNLVRAMPFAWASNLGAGALGTLGPLVSAHKVAKRNLEIVFPDETQAERDRLLAHAWRNLGRLAGEYPNLPRLRIYDPGSRVTVVDAERLDAIRDAGQAAVFIGGHFAAFEIMAAAIAQRGVPCRMTYRPANNYWVNERIMKTRAGYGAKLQAAKGKEGGMALMRALAKGEGVAIMNDQKYNEGVASPFFGTTVMTADGPTRLARRFNCPLVPLSIKRVNGSRFVVTVHEPIARDDDPDEETAVFNTVARINAFMERAILEAPADWFWVHRRWDRAVYKGADPEPAPTGPAPKSADTAAA